jgi:regulator of RNase E activity RraA
MVGARYRSHPRAIWLPGHAVGANPNGPTKNIAGRVNWPVSVGGTAVQPGDLIVGDADAWWWSSARKPLAAGGGCQEGRR